jgi:hypothetical protein
MRPELKLWLSIFGICIIEFMLAANNFTSSNFTGTVFVKNWFTNDKMQKKKKVELFNFLSRWQHTKFSWAFFFFL